MEPSEQLGSEGVPGGTVSMCAVLLDNWCMVCALVVICDFSLLRFGGGFRVRSMILSRVYLV